MAQAMAQVIGYVTRSRAFMPPGVVGPFITRFDGGSVPVGQLIFSSPTRPPAEMQDIALNRVRPLFATLPGVSAPPPFGGNQRTIVVRLDPDKLRSYRISPEEAIAAVNRASSVQPAGNIRIGDLNHFATSNAALGANLPELLDAPVRPGENPPVFLRDIGVVENGADILTAYAHVNGKRTVYMQITKRSDASTLDVIRTVRANLAAFKTVCPEDVDVRVEFDQSTVVTQALSALGTEAVLGAVLTGLMVLLFLRDWRSSLIVITTIPVALLSALVGLWGLGQTINIMTLGGLALAVGVLVDEATVEIENIHTHMTGGLSRVESVLAACRKTATARLLSMLTILAVFAPALFLTGVGRQLFVPLSLAVALAMAASYVLSSTLVPVLAAKFVRPAAHRPGSMLYSNLLGTLLPLRWVIAPLYLLLAAGVIYLVLPGLGTELFPAADAGQFKLRLRARTGTRIERTEEYALQALQLMQREVPVAISSAFIGVQPASYPINTIFLWTSGPHEAVFQVALKPEATLRGEALRERLRAVFAKELPQVQVSFEAGDIVSDVLSFGSPTPVEVAIQGPALPANRAHAEKVMAELRKLPALRDLQFAQPLDYPTVDVQIDRERAGQYGLTMANVARSLVAATSSSRFVDPNYWRDPNSGNAFQIQVEIPQHRMASVNDLADLPVMQNREARPTLGDVATIKPGKTYGLVERYNMQRVVSITANLHNIPLGEAEAQIRAAIRRAGEPARGVTVQVRGQVPALNSTLDGLRLGLAVAIAAILLLLTAYFQSLRLALVVLSTVPAVLAGVVLALRFTGTTLNLQSFMGAIMATGIAIANSILLVTFAELARRSGGTLAVAAAARLRAVLMTAFAMMAGMTPMALGAAQTAPLGRAVLGGLALATVATLTVVPLFYNILQPQNARDASLLPHEENS
jgi:multidrug efflux pump subunit AcrB